MLSEQYSCCLSEKLRLKYEGAVHHLAARGNAKQPIFLAKGDRILFLNVLIGIVDRFGWMCHAYCLMTNHYHLLIETPLANLSHADAVPGFLAVDWILNQFENDL